MWELVRLRNRDFLPYSEEARHANPEVGVWGVFCFVVGLAAGVSLVITLAAVLSQVL